jgi:hypothetical protein
MTEHDQITQALIGEMGRADIEAPPRRDTPVEREMWLRRAPYPRSEMWLRSSPSWWRRLLAALGLRPGRANEDRPARTDQARIFGGARRRVAIKAAAKQQSRVFGKRRP